LGIIGVCEGIGKCRGRAADCLFSCFATAC